MLLLRGSILALALLAVASAPAAANGGAWMRLPGGYYFKIGLSSLSADQEYGRAGTLQPIFNDTGIVNASFGVTDISLHGEYGITDWLTAVASTQYKVAVRQGESRSSRRDTTASASGLSDLWVDGRVRLLPLDAPCIATLTLGLKLPTGSPYQQIPLGSGVVDYQTAIAVAGGFPLGALSGYAHLCGGYRFRNNAGNELRYLMELGVHLNEGLLLQGLLDGAHSMADFDAPFPDAGGVAESLVFDQSYLRWNLGAIIAVGDGLDLNVGYGRYASGRNALSGGSFAIGIAWKR